MRCALAIAFVVGLACGGRQSVDSGGRGSGVIMFDSEVKDARVWIDGEHLPGAITRGVELAAGPHRIEIRHERYHTVYFEVTVVRGQNKTLKVRPAEILP